MGAVCSSEGADLNQTAAKATEAHDDGHNHTAKVQVKHSEDTDAIPTPPKAEEPAKAVTAEPAKAVTVKVAPKSPASPTTSPRPVASKSPASPTTSPRPVAKASPPKDQKLFHRLVVHVIAARGLRNADGFLSGKSDPFVIFEVEGKESSRVQTKVMNENLDPSWNASAEFVNVAVTDKLVFAVYDQDTFTHRDQLGKVSLPHAKFLPLGFEGELRLEETLVESYITVKVELVDAALAAPDSACTATLLNDPSKKEGAPSKVGIPAPKAEVKPKSKTAAKAKAQADPAAPGAATAAPEAAKGKSKMTVRAGSSEALVLPAAGATGSGEVLPPVEAPAPKKASKAAPKKKAPAEEAPTGDVFHTFKILLISARGLREGDSDPFVTCEIVTKPKSRFQSKVINDTTEPKWGTLAECSGVSPSDTLLLTVYDKDTFTAHDLLGKVSVPVSKFLPVGFEGEMELQEAAGGAKSKLPAFIHFKVDLVATTVSDPNKVVCTSKKLQDGLATILAPEECPKCMCTIVSAKGLRNADVLGASDPYVVVEIPGKPRSRIRTPVILDHLDPVWNYTGQIFDYEPGDCLSFSVFDKDFGCSDDRLGRCMLTREKLYPFSFDADIPLKQACNGAATLHVKVTFPQ